MGCSPSHALIINSSSRTHEPLCLQPRIYMVSESTLRILQDVGELRLYQQEDKDPGIARVRFGTKTIDQLANPVEYQSQVRRQCSVNSEQGFTVSRRGSKSTINLEKTQEQTENFVEDDSLAGDELEIDEGPRLRRENTSQSFNSSSSTLIVGQIHNPLSLKNIAKESIYGDRDEKPKPTEAPDSRRNSVQSNHPSCDNLQERE